MATEKISWFYESAADRKKEVSTHTPSFGAYRRDGDKPFNERFEELAAGYLENGKIDVKRDIKKLLADRSFMEQYREDLMEPIISAFEEACPNDPHVQSIIGNVRDFWDTKVKNYTESANITSFLPISTLEFPVLVKQMFGSILKDIIEVEVVKTPSITKHIRTTYIVDNQTGAELEYPKCMFDGTWQQMWDASKGHKIREEVVPLTDGRLWKYDIITGLTDGTPGLDRLSFAFKIIAVQIAPSKLIPLMGNGITVEFSTNGTLVNGDLDFTYNGDHVEDTIGGQVDFRNGTVTLASASGQVTGVVFSGYLSNEKNLRSTSVREKRDILRFTIEDGARMNMPFTIEEIDDAAALLDINYYNRMVDEIVKVQEMTECMTVIQFFDDEFKKYNGITTDIYKLESTAQTYSVDIKPPAGYAGDPFKYVARAIQFRLKALIHQLTDMTKLDGLSWVVVGNPMATQTISEFVEWKTTTGSTMGGIDVNTSYGFGTDMGANVRVVATNLYDAYTATTVDATSKRELVLHIYAYPTDAEHISFRHLTYTSHLLTSQSQTAYQSPAAPGGAYNIVTATSRFKDISVQGIEARLVLLNSDVIYGQAPTRPPITGAPWN